MDLEVAEAFDILCRSGEFPGNIDAMARKLEASFRHLRNSAGKYLKQSDLGSLEDFLKVISAELQKITLSLTDKVDPNLIEITYLDAERLCWRIERELGKPIDPHGPPTQSETSPINAEQKGQSLKELSEYEIEHLRSIISYLRNDFISVRSYIMGKNDGLIAKIINSPFLWVSGEAGMGKTHLFCDVAIRRVRKDAPTILLLGEGFAADEPWSQIFKLLGLHFTGPDEFLGALQAAAEASDKKVLILIDALNEGPQRYNWQKHLAGMIERISGYPLVSFAFGVRSSYEPIIVPENLGGPNPPRLWHTGFSGIEFDAAEKIFLHYGINFPSTPLLLPEFSNPQFLILFCRGLSNLGIHDIRPGVSGRTAIYEYFLNSVNSKLSRPEYLDFDPKSRPVFKAIEALSETMAETGASQISRLQANDLFNRILPDRGYDKSLLRHLISEGMLKEEYDGKNAPDEVVRFTYERLGEYLIVRYLLGTIINRAQPNPGSNTESVIEKGLGALFQRYFPDEHSMWRNKGLLESYFIQIPELLKREVFDLFPALQESQAAWEAFWQSVPWRDEKSLTEGTRTYIETNLGTDDAALDTLLTLSTRPGHPYNADYLYGYLNDMPMPERDRSWSIYLYENYDHESPVDSILKWAWARSTAEHIDDDSARLAALVLSWFFTTSHRFLRDRASKAMVNLLSTRSGILEKVITTFKDVDDPYVSERLFAAAYGCAIRGIDRAKLESLAHLTYDLVFRHNRPPAHILLRDYARGVIETALIRGIQFRGDEKKIRPPYSSPWLKSFPSDDDLKKLSEAARKPGSDGRSVGHLRHSIMSSLIADFAIYVITPSVEKWTPYILSDDLPPTPKEVYQGFVESLTEEQSRLFKKYKEMRDSRSFALIFRSLSEPEKIVGLDELGKDVNKKERPTKKGHKPKADKEKMSMASDAALDKKIKAALNKFRGSLDSKRLDLFESIVLPYLEGRLPRYGHGSFDVQAAQRWIFQRVLELGWTEGRFGEFDDSVPERGRTPHKPERIGKKYQWIALHELLARLSDNYRFAGDPYGDGIEDYQGPWQIGRRDIDPTSVLKSTGKTDSRRRGNCWWSPVPYDTWMLDKPAKAWLSGKGDLPDPLSLIEIRQNDTGRSWYVLDTYLDWEEPTLRGQGRWDKKRRTVRYHLRSYLVDKGNAKRFIDWLAENDYLRKASRDVPDWHDSHGPFLGEFFGHPAYRYYDTPYYGQDGWTKGMEGSLPAQIYLTAESYFKESGDYDCSVEGPIRIFLPARLMAEGLSFSWRVGEGKLFDSKGELVSFDPSVFEEGPGALLMEKESLLEFLRAKQYEIVWLVTGEKLEIGGEIGRENYVGRLYIGGAYRLLKDSLKGEINAKFEHFLQRGKQLVTHRAKPVTKSKSRKPRK